MIYVMCQRGLFIPGVCQRKRLKSSHKVYRKSPPPFSLGLIIYCIVWGMFKITNLETQWPMGSQSHSSFFEQCLHGGGSDGGTCRTHPDRSCWFECLLLCVMTFELLHKIFLQNYHWVSFILFFLPSKPQHYWMEMYVQWCVDSLWSKEMHMMLHVRYYLVSFSCHAIL